MCWIGEWDGFGYGCVVGLVPGLLVTRAHVVSASLFVGENLQGICCNLTDSPTVEELVSSSCSNSIIL